MVYLAKEEAISDKTDIGFDVHIYIDPSTRDIAGIWAHAPYGISDYSKEKDRWVAVSSRDKRGVQWQDFAVYKIDWSNKADFDENNKSKILSMYADGSLDEDYLKQNAIFVRNPL